MATKIYIDHFAENNTIAFTSNAISIPFNLIALDRFKKDSPPVFTAGKYLAILWASNPPSLTFIDIKKNPKMVQTIINGDEFKKNKSQIISILEGLNSIYDSVKDDVELIQGTPPGAKPLK